MDRAAHETLGRGPARPWGRGLVRAATETREHRHEGSDLLGGGVAEDLDAWPGLRTGGLVLAGSGWGGFGAHSGMFPCFFGGRVSRLVRRARRARLTFIRVLLGVMTVSM